jgi:hypothetical protein
MRHVLVIYRGHGRWTVLWDSDCPCPWNLQKFLVAENRAPELPAEPSTPEPRMYS